MIEAARTWRLLRNLRAGSRRSAASLQELQAELLRTAVAHAYQNVPFYRRVWSEAGFDATSLHGIRDLRRIPITGGPEVREAAKRGELLARGVDPARCTIHSTSGFSGAPVRVRRQALERRLWQVTLGRMLLEHGFRWRDVTVQFDAAPGPVHLLQRLGIARTTWIPPTLPVEEQVATLVKAGASVVMGTPTALRRICRSLEAAAQVARPRIVFCAGEVLDAETRATVKRVLGVDPLSLYGLTEVGYVAWQCEAREGLHVNAELYLVEVVRNGRPAEPGELGTIVLSDLRGRTMPLLRYDTGDLAVAAAGPCPCGRRLPVLGSIEGRAQACAVLEDGRIITPRVALDHLAGALRLGTYRLHQETMSEFRLELAAAARVDRAEAVPAAALARLRELLGDVDISIEVARSLGDEAAKTHTVASAVPCPIRSG